MWMHIWPVLPKAAATQPSAAFCRSASLRTISGFLPPSSSEAPIRRRPACSPTVRRCSVEPVKQM